MVEASTDRIEREVVLRAPLARVWRALTDAGEFGRWFGVEMKDTFEAGRTARGRITHPGYEHVVFEIQVERVEPERVFSWRWHPAAVEKGRDYSQEPSTLVVFELEEVPEGTRLRITESGFDRIPVERRSEALRLNSDGWTAQVRNIERHVSAAR
jgi:uncharacterized protein YndB with AHSA1/START domain